MELRLNLALVQPDVLSVGKIVVVINWQSLYDKLTDPCCEDCIRESDAMLHEVKHLFEMREVELILRERSRCLAMGLSRVDASIRMKKVVKPILARLAGPLTW